MFTYLEHKVFLLFHTIKWKLIFLILMLRNSFSYENKLFCFTRLYLKKSIRTLCVFKFKFKAKYFFGIFQNLCIILNLFLPSNYLHASLHILFYWININDKLQYIIYGKNSIRKTRKAFFNMWVYSFFLKHLLTDYVCTSF